MSDREVARLPRKLTGALVLIVCGVFYGFFAAVNNWPGAQQLNFIRLSVTAVLGEFGRPWYMSAKGPGFQVENLDPQALAPGLILVSGVGNDKMNFIRVIDRQGDVIQSWSPDWFEIWPDFDVTVPALHLPKSQPGAVIHGVQILPDGDVLMNFEFLSTVRLSPCGDVRWKLDNLGHHSIKLAEDGTIWVTAERYIADGDTGYDNYTAPVESWTIQNISMDGEILRTIDVLDILLRNDLLGLMYMSFNGEGSTLASGDSLHVNDVDIFPSGMASEVFSPGDIMISLRNINTILVVDPTDLRVKFRSTGKFLHQHDPGFLPLMIKFWCWTTAISNHWCRLKIGIREFLNWTRVPGNRAWRSAARVTPDFIPRSWASCSNWIMAT